MNEDSKQQSPWWEPTMGEFRWYLWKIGACSDSQKWLEVVLREMKLTSVREVYALFLDFIPEEGPYQSRVEIFPVKDAEDSVIWCPRDWFLWLWAANRPLRVRVPHSAARAVTILEDNDSIYADEAHYLKAKLTYENWCLFFKDELEDTWEIAKEDYISDFSESYRKAILFTGQDESTEDGGKPLDENYTTDDFTDAADTIIRENCQKFLDSEVWRRYMMAGVHRNWDVWRIAGHRFWMSHSGSGSGFLDDRMFGEFGGELQKLSESIGTQSTALVTTDRKIDIL